MRRQFYPAAIDESDEAEWEGERRSGLPQIAACGFANEWTLILPDPYTARSFVGEAASGVDDNWGYNRDHDRTDYR
jgi:hypothetical protein